jgi:hypothetical protein
MIGPADRIIARSEKAAKGPRVIIGEGKFPRMDQVVETGGSLDPLHMLMALLAGVNSQMITIAEEMRKKSVVINANRGCDLREYRSAFRFDDKAFYAFEAYVEADTREGSLVCWLVDINWTPGGWELHRTMHIRRDRESEDVIETFPTLSSQNFTEFASGVRDAMHGFVESVRSYHHH